MTSDTSVPLIVGAGPVGLTLANELLRHGVRPRIIDRAPQRSQNSKALAIFPRTLELLETTGVIDRFLTAGHRIRGLSLHHRDQGLAEIKLASVVSPYPFVLSLPQSETERLLGENLAEAGLEVERNVELLGLTQTDERVEAKLRYGDGREEMFSTPWLIGCDGAHSTTRHAIGMSFEGSAYDESFILADVRLESPLSRERVHLYLSGEGVLGFIPFADNQWRVVANIAPDSRHQNLPDLSLGEVQTLVEQRASATFRLSDPGWLARFHISHRRVAQFRRLRVFLAGDAAHIHSPAGGQGMNTGMQDAWNLGWKLALVLRGWALPALLGSYHPERSPVAQGVINLTDRLTRTVTVRNSVAQSVRDFLLPVMSGIDFVGEKMAERLAELSVNYRGRELVENHGGGKIRAGDRAPDAELRDQQNQARRLFELFRAPRHVLLVFLGTGEAGPEKTAALAASCDGLPEKMIDLWPIRRGLTGEAAELRDTSGLAHAAYGLVEGGLILVRPDGYVAYRSNDFAPAKLKAYFTRIFGPRPENADPS